MQYKEIRGKRIYFEREDNNSKPTIFFFHDISDNSEAISSLKHFIRRYNIVTFDMPGHGESDDLYEYRIGELINNLAPFLRAFEFIGNQEIILAGLGVGAILATAVSTRISAKLILINPYTPYMLDKKVGVSPQKVIRHYFPDTKEQVKNEMKNSVKNPERKYFFNNLDKTVEFKLDEISEKKNVINKWKECFEKQLIDPKYVSEELMTIYENATISLIIATDNDSVIPYSTSLSLAKYFKTPLINIENCGRNPIFEYPKKMNDIFNLIATNKFKYSEAENYEEIVTKVEEEEARLIATEEAIKLRMTDEEKEILELDRQIEAELNGEKLEE